MHRERQARSSPLLRSLLSAGFRAATAPATASNMVMVSQVVLCLPELVGAQRLREASRAPGANSGLEPDGSDPANLHKRRRYCCQWRMWLARRW